MPIKVVKYIKGISIASPVYLDANFPISYSVSGHPKYQPAMELLFELYRQKIEICISSLIFDEFWYGIKKFLGANNIAPTQIYRTTQDTTNRMLRWTNVRFLPADIVMTKNSIRHALDFYIHQNLRPRDSFHLALAILSNSAGFVTSDDDFDNVDIPDVNLTIYKY